MTTVYCHWKEAECTKEELFDCIHCPIRNYGVKALHFQSSKEQEPQQ